MCKISLSRVVLPNLWQDRIQVGKETRHRIKIGQSLELEARAFKMQTNLTYLS